MNWQHLIAISTLIVLHSGCNAVIPKASDAPLANKLLPQKVSQKEPLSGPSRMAIIWKENVFQPPVNKPVRGFTGRIYFYNSEDELVTADGELVVYGYDDSQTSLKETADRKYVFPAEKFAKHYAQSELGHSYSIWLPWEEYGGFRKSISLLPAFKLANGQIIQGGADHLSLSGRVPKKATVERTIASSPNAHPSENNPNYNFSQESANRQTQVRQVQSLQIPESLAKRMANQPLANLPVSRELAAQRPNQILDNAARNQSGDSYNVVHRSRNSNPQRQSTRPAQQTPMGPTQSNFSDTPAGNAAPQQSSLSVQRPPQRRVFGQPGVMR